MTKDILKEVDLYYTNRINEYGATPKGVDWNGEEGQHLRFSQICKIISQAEFSINDLGCGYGALLDFLTANYDSFNYFGTDLSEKMIDCAKLKFKATESIHFSQAATPAGLADYSVASGIFNVRQERSNHEWLNYIEETLDTLDRCSKHGFSFNCLTKYSDIERQKSYLYYADPSYFFDLCKKRYSLNVALLHDYGLYEFTVLVRK